MADLRFETSIRADFELGSWKGWGNIENAGCGGLFIRSDAVPERGEKVWLSFPGPNGEPVQALGIVWWTTLDPGVGPLIPGFGVRLVASSGEYRRLLERLAAQPTTHGPWVTVEG